MKRKSYVYDSRINGFVSASRKGLDPILRKLYEYELTLDDFRLTYYHKLGYALIPKSKHTKIMIKMAFGD